MCSFTLGHWIIAFLSILVVQIGTMKCFYCQQEDPFYRFIGIGVIGQNALSSFCVGIIHLEERLLDQAQARTPYTPPFLGSFA